MTTSPIDFQQAAITMITAANVAISGSYSIANCLQLSGVNFPCIVLTVPGDIEWDYNTVSGTFEVGVYENFDHNLSTDEETACQLNVVQISTNVYNIVQALKALPQNIAGYLIYPKYSMSNTDCQVLGPETDYSGTRFRMGKFTIIWGTHG